MQASSAGTNLIEVRQVNLSNEMFAYDPMLAIKVIKPVCFRNIDLPLAFGPEIILTGRGFSETLKLFGTN